MRGIRNNSRKLSMSIFLLFFLSGFAAGVVFGCVFGADYRDYAGILSEYYLSRYPYMEPDDKFYFLYLLLINFYFMCNFIIFYHILSFITILSIN